MNRSVGATLVLGALGIAVLTGLGVWQMQRLGWKTLMLERIEARIAAAPVSVPENTDPIRDAYLPVRVTGRLLAPEIRVLASARIIGPGYRIITALETGGGRRIMVDRGFLPESGPATPPRPEGTVTFTGNLHWPDEVDSFTPDPDPAADLWFARDVARMAQALGTEPVLLVARDSSQPVPSLDPMPVDTAAIPNHHLQYAITWFALAVIWAGVTLVMVRRIRQGR